MRPSGDRFSARAQCVSADFRRVSSEAERGKGPREAAERKKLPAGGVGGRKWESEFPSGVKGDGEKLRRENVEEKQGTRSKVPSSREVEMSAVPVGSVGAGKRDPWSWSRNQSFRSGMAEDEVAHTVTEWYTSLENTPVRSMLAHSAFASKNAPTGRRRCHLFEKLNPSRRRVPASQKKRLPFWQATRCSCPQG